MYTQEELDAQLSVKDTEIQELADRVEELEGEIKYLERENEKLEEAEDADVDLSGFDSKDLIDALMVDATSMEDKRKAELFFEHYSAFREDEFEEFLKSKGAILMYGQ